jgi:hypothetical protein
MQITVPEVGTIVQRNELPVAGPDSPLAGVGAGTRYVVRFLHLLDVRGQRHIGVAPRHVVETYFRTDERQITIGTSLVRNAARISAEDYEYHPGICQERHLRVLRIAAFLVRLDPDGQPVDTEEAIGRRVHSLNKYYLQAVLPHWTPNCLLVDVQELGRWFDVAAA